MRNRIGYIYGFKLELFSPPSLCQSGAVLEQYTYYYQKGYYRQLAGNPYYYCYESQQKTSLRMAA